MRNLSDQEIIDSVRKGNDSDYSIIINRYKNKAFSMLKRMLKNEFDAEEILQDCFLKAYNSLINFKGEAKFSTWFYRIVYNSALTKLSSQKRKIESEMSSVEEHFDLQSEHNADDFEKKDIQEFIQDIIKKLPERHSAIITMFYLNEMSIEEISDVMGISISNVKVMLHRSRNTLRDLFLKSKLSEEFI
ncbi:MAG: sigma-70 family RNA polymerase sigma factor [Ignavibacteriaceae bacterium]|jgi:RNA polymerase sigma-70 factor (ECF subfamily)|nr:sigma-70 family RNA polymerase sigma factor [Ignavibacteriaceae bacterium]